MNVSAYDVKRIYTFYQEAKQLLESRMCSPRMCLTYPTRICNQNCYYCSDGKTNQRFHTIMLKKQLLALPAKYVSLDAESVELCGGGEPFLHPNIKEFIHEVKRCGLKIASLTNGTMLKGELAELVVENFSYVRISVDSLDKETYEEVRRPKNRNAGFDQVVTNIRNLVRLKEKVKSPILIGIKSSFDRTNIEQMGEYIRGGIEMGVDGVTVRIARNVGKDLSPNQLSYYLSMLEHWKRGSTKPRVGGDLRKTNLEGLCWCSPFHIFVDTDGSVRICCYYQHREKEHTYGNVFEQDIREIWWGRKHLTAVKKINPELCNLYDCKYHAYNKILFDAVILDKAQWQFV